MSLPSVSITYTAVMGGCRRHFSVAAVICCCLKSLSEKSLSFVWVLICVQEMDMFIFAIVIKFNVFLFIWIF